MRIRSIPLPSCFIVMVALLSACQQSARPPAPGSGAPAAAGAPASPASENPPGAAAAPPGGDASTAAAAPVRDWCGGHGVPESVCTRCNAELIPAFKARGDWCPEHGLPESQCTLCNPELIEKFRKMAPKPPETGAREEAPDKRPYQGVRVRLATPETAARAGIATEAVSRSAVDRWVSAPVRLGFDQTRSARLSSPVAGTLRELRVAVGTPVRAGDPVLAIASRELAEAAARLREAEAALVAAETTLAREERLVARDVSPRKDLIEAKRGHEAARASVASARGVLAALGASHAPGGELAAGGPGQDGSLLVLRAPRAGVVTDLHVAAGQTIEADLLLVEIHDPSRLWADLEVAEADATSIRAGVAVVLEFDSLPGREIAGTVTWLAPRVDPRTRTVAARAEVANDDGVLRAGMYGRGRLRLEAGPPGVLAPSEAVQDAPEGPVAFVQIDGQIYEPRALLLGRSSGGRVEVLTGLAPGEQVVTRGSFLLKTEIMKGSLGAGCCDAVEK